MLLAMSSAIVVKRFSLLTVGHTQTAQRSRKLGMVSALPTARERRKARAPAGRFAGTTLMPMATQVRCWPLRLSRVQVLPVGVPVRASVTMDERRCAVVAVCDTQKK